jgi:hypothetical protein
MDHSGHDLERKKTLTSQTGVRYLESQLAAEAAF